MMKVDVINRCADVIISNTKRDVEEGELSVEDIVCQLKSRIITTIQQQ